MARSVLLRFVMAIAIDELTELIIGAAINVHRELGPGLLESIYRDCVHIELGLAGVNVEVERRVPIFYRGQPIRDDLKVDLLVDGRIVVEIKAVDRMHPVHQAQVMTYLKLSGCPAGLLFNFNTTSLRSGLSASIIPTFMPKSIRASARPLNRTPPSRLSS